MLETYVLTLLVLVPALATAALFLVKAESRLAIRQLSVAVRTHRLAPVIRMPATIAAMAPAVAIV